MNKIRITHSQTTKGPIRINTRSGSDSIDTNLQPCYIPFYHTELVRSDTGVRVVVDESRPGSVELVPTDEVLLSLEQGEMKALSDSGFNMVREIPSGFVEDEASLFYRDIFNGTCSSFFQFRFPVFGGRQVMWKDAEGTIPATTAGDLVGRVDDVVNPKFWLSQDVEEFKPVWNGIELEFDGVDDVLNGNSNDIAGHLHKFNDCGIFARMRKGEITSNIEYATIATVSSTYEDYAGIALLVQWNSRITNPSRTFIGNSVFTANTEISRSGSFGPFKSMTEPKVLGFSHTKSSNVTTRSYKHYLDGIVYFKVSFANSWIDTEADFPLKVGGGEKFFSKSNVEYVSIYKNEPTPSDILANK